MKNSKFLNQDAEPKKKLLTLDAIFKEYPEILNEFGWSRKDIQVFFDSFLLKGLYHPSDSADINNLLIESKSLDILIEYRRKVDRETEEGNENSG